MTMKSSSFQDTFVLMDPSVGRPIIGFILLEDCLENTLDLKSLEMEFGEYITEAYF